MLTKTWVNLENRNVKWLKKLLQDHSYWLINTVTVWWEGSCLPSEQLFLWLQRSSNWVLRLLDVDKKTSRRVAWLWVQGAGTGPFLATSLKWDPWEPGEVSSGLWTWFCASKNGYMGISQSTWVLPDVTRVL